MSIILVANIVALLFSFFVVGCILGALFSRPIREVLVEVLTGRRDLLLARTVCNPILKPGETPWTAEAVLNPAAVVLGGRTHLVYRAIGMDGVSRLGYASSGNGMVFDDRIPYPVYIAQRPERAPGFPTRGHQYSPVMYPSGGSWGGCEDPRMVAIDGRVYVTYNAFDGWDYIRAAFISIATDDFLAKQWRWNTPKLLSPTGERHKNWMLFPEKIQGRFALLHSLHGEESDQVCIQYIDDIDTFDPDIDGFHSPYFDASPAHRAAWHTQVRSAGPPPIRTERGWLVFYHAMSEGEHHRYKLGAMLLDLADPTKVLHRATAPVLSPDAPYENHGKPGIVYSCGAVIRGDMLYVYYVGADKVVCVATAPLAPFLNALIAGAPSPLEPLRAHTR